MAESGAFASFENLSFRWQKSVVLCDMEKTKLQISLLDQHLSDKIKLDTCPSIAHFVTPSLKQKAEQETEGRRVSF